jgi:Na+/proline symporter
MMSTIAGAINSLTAVLFKDMLPLISSQLPTQDKEVIYCKHLTLLLGLLTMILALLLFRLGGGLRTTVLEVVSVCAALWPILFSAFLYGVLSTRVSAKAMFVSLIIGIAVGVIFPYVFYYGVSEEHRWGFQWVSLPGQIVAFVLPPLLSLIWPNKKTIDGLTVYTTK